MGRESLKNFRKQKMRILKSHSAENSKRDPFNIRSVAKYQKIERTLFGDI